MKKTKEVKEEKTKNELEMKICEHTKSIANSVVQETRRTAQLGQPARVWPTATQSEDFGGQTQVSNCQTQPPVGRLSILHFKTREARPESIPLTFPAKY